ncbi:MAG: hypothetical protein IPI46_09240 [Bacteroidetes bacterium]|nr:hypothetical protein [Bacteroidota bacterium]
MKIRIFLSLLFIACICNHLQAQNTQNKNEQDDKKTSSKIIGKQMFNFSILGGYDIPAADMAKRFGKSYRLGLSINYKSASNYFFGVKGELLTGNQIKEDSLLWNIKTSQNGVISQLGEVLNVGTFERGYMIGLQFGKIFPIHKKNPNSGFTTTFSTGFIQHKIKMFDKDLSFPQLRDEYVKGYDRLANGLYFENYTGYTHFSKNKLINFTAGLDFVWGLTKGRRDYLYDVARKDDASRNDILIGFKVGWIVPIYKKMSEETYY